MTIEGRPAADVAIDASTVRALLQEQHPDLVSLPLIDVGAGWDNQMYRLGDTLAVRLPRRAAAAPLVVHEQRWLPVLASRLPLPIPAPLRTGRPGCGFPWSWSVVPWFEGRSAAVAPPADALAAATSLGACLCALHQPAPFDAPYNPWRGVPLAERSAAVRERALRLADQLDSRRIVTLWDEIVRTPPWSGPPLWIHGDLHPGNLLVHHGLLSAIIDFGDLTAGDPATDLSVAWMLLPASARPAFRAAARRPDESVDDDTWTRARGWALALGLAYLAGSRDDQRLEAVGRATVRAALEEH